MRAAPRSAPPATAPPARSRSGRPPTDRSPGLGARGGLWWWGAEAEQRLTSPDTGPRLLLACFSRANLSGDHADIEPHACRTAWHTACFLGAMVRAQHAPPCAPGQQSTRSKRTDAVALRRLVEVRLVHELAEHLLLLNRIAPSVPPFSATLKRGVPLRQRDRGARCAPQPPRARLHAWLCRALGCCGEPQLAQHLLCSPHSLNATRISE